MIKSSRILLLLFLPCFLFGQDTTKSISDLWREQPAVPFPTLDHHIGKITAGLAVYSILRLGKVDPVKSGWITTGLAITFELIQYLFFDETLLHSLNDVVLFSYHWGAHYFLEKKYIEGTAITFSLTGLYFHFLVIQQ